VPPLMAVEYISRVPGRPVGVVGKLSGPVRLGQRVQLRRGQSGFVAEVVDLSFGFHRTPPELAEAGVEAAVHLRGEGTEHLSGDGWEMFTSDAERDVGVDPRLESW
jgi:hypothetical protein